MPCIGEPTETEVAADRDLATQLSIASLTGVTRLVNNQFITPEAAERTVVLLERGLLTRAGERDLEGHSTGSDHGHFRHVTTAS